MVVFAVDPDQDTNIQADPSNILEYIYDRGTLKIREKNLIYIGPNPKKDEEK
ncbi:hypothetical protein [Chitinophaga caeni]|uniref:hypothetical protein n=1 Tax=Chitinophaga caeni TaxID=2029983 RepID=UPI0012FE4649|nr:hypothetical protein [Chitinophaga caeni]